MSDKWMPLSHRLVTSRDSNTLVAYHIGRYYSDYQFELAVKVWADKLQAQPFQNYALYTEDAYPFAVLLFALLHAGKNIWLPGNNRPGTAQHLSQHCKLLGDWHSGECFDYCLQIQEISTPSLAPLDPWAQQLVIFTSGSTGEAKPIVKCLNQFQLEIATLEQRWGKRLGNATALATVSHQHIYGLLFRVLWPLSAGRCFYSQTYRDPASLISAMQQESAYWIASPAQLKRLGQYSPWQGIANLKAIFSSGGALTEQAAQQLLTASNQAVIEIYGSSETGGIAWRQRDQAWTLFTGMELTRTDDNWLLHSPYLQSSANQSLKSKSIQLDDHITALDNGRFILHGRLDRIVKVEEKRLSLAELEQRLLATPWIDEAHAVVINKNRDIVAVALVLNQQGVYQLTTEGRVALIRRLRKVLAGWFEPVLLPRKWLFVNTIPLTKQGKIDQPLLKSLLDFDSQKFPQALHLQTMADEIQLGLKVLKELAYFPDHFASYPILPGVVQLAWVEHFGKLFFVMDRPFSHLEVIKFTQVIQPGDELTLSLNWKASSGKLYFNFSSDRGTHSSGRMVYGNNA
jgi:acyl-CoA synthetase (AMP-forming)/AMP-acid ligase II